MVDPVIGPRAGFWRRALAVMIDCIIVGLPFQVIAAILFAATSGWIQMSVGGVTYTSCVVVQQIPDTLTPPPPAGANIAHECRVFFFGVETARILKLDRTTTKGAITKTIYLRTYMLDREGHPINGVSIDWFVMAVLVAYVVARETRTGATLGDRAARIRVVDVAAADASGVPFRKIIVRYLVLYIGFAPAYAIQLFFGDMNATAVIVLTWTLGFGWIIVNVVLIIGPFDPLYDRIARTAVVRV
jgi:hypothetical protein